MSRCNSPFHRPVAVLTTTGTAVLVLLAAACGPRPGDLQTYREVGEFQLTERSGEPVSNDDLAGRIWVANFFFAGCVSECSVVMDRMAKLQQLLQGRSDVLLVSFTTDPRSDTPEALQKFAARFEADPRGWLFLTGDRRAILRTVVHSFLMPVTRDPREQADLLSGIVHTDKMALVDRSGVVRAYFEGLKPDAPEAVLAAIDRLAAETPAPALNSIAASHSP